MLKRKKVKGVNNNIKLLTKIGRRGTINIYGNESELIVGKNVNWNHFSITIRGNNTKVYIGERVSFDDGVVIKVIGNNSKLIIEEDTTIGRDTLIMSFDGKKIHIGKDCMISRYVHIRNSDGHSIRNKEGILINNANDIDIGSHVWLGHRVTVLKGCWVGTGTVVGACSTLTSKRYNEASIYAGNPAKLIRTDIFWER